MFFNFDGIGFRQEGEGGWVEENDPLKIKVNYHKACRLGSPKKANSTGKRTLHLWFFPGSRQTPKALRSSCCQTISRCFFCYFVARVLIERNSVLVIPFRVKLSLLKGLVGFSVC